MLLNRQSQEPNLYCIPSYPPFRDHDFVGYRGFAKSRSSFKIANSSSFSATILFNRSFSRLSSSRRLSASLSLCSLFLGRGTTEPFLLDALSQLCTVFLERP